MKMQGASFHGTVSPAAQASTRAIEVLTWGVLFSILRLKKSGFLAQGIFIFWSLYDSND
jgi:hypothetical protein